MVAIKSDSPITIVISTIERAGDNVEFVINPNVEESKDSSRVTESGFCNLRGCIFADSSIDMGSFVCIMLQGGCKGIAGSEGSGRSCTKRDRRHCGRRYRVLVKIKEKYCNSIKNN
jgi:hypothetical protein